MSAAAYAAIVKPASLFPRRITSHKLRNERRGYRRDAACGFYMDATRLDDVTDYWNLRALGRAVLPIPKQFVAVPEFLDYIRKFVKSHYRISRQNPAISYGTTIVRSSRSEMSELQALANALDLPTLIPGDPSARSVSLQHWYPRVWDEWAMGKDGAIPDDVSCQVEDHSFQDAQGTLSFSLVKPDFARTGFKQPRATPTRFILSSTAEAEPSWRMCFRTIMVAGVARRRWDGPFSATNIGSATPGL